MCADHKTISNRADGHPADISEPGKHVMSINLKNWPKKKKGKFNQIESNQLESSLQLINWLRGKLNCLIFRGLDFKNATGTTWTQEMVWLINNDCDFEGAKRFLHHRSPQIE